MVIRGLRWAGGLIGDAIGSGRDRRAVVGAGLAVLALGYGLLCLRDGLLPALALVALGAGLLKPNLVAQVAQCAGRAGLDADRAFGGYVIAANLGALAAPLVCGTLGERVAWRLRYAAAAAAGLAVYALAWSRLGPGFDAPKAAADAGRSRRRGAGGAPGWVAALAAETLFFGVYDQAFNVFPIWARDHMNLRLGSVAVPVTWFNALDGLFTLGASTLAVQLWRRSPGFDPRRRMAIDAGLAAAAFLQGAGPAEQLAPGGPTRHGALARRDRPRRRPSARSAKTQAGRPPLALCDHLGCRLKNSPPAFEAAPVCATATSQSGACHRCDPVRRERGRRGGRLGAEPQVGPEARLALVRTSADPPSPCPPEWPDRHSCARRATAGGERPPSSPRGRRHRQSTGAAEERDRSALRLRPSGPRV